MSVSAEVLDERGADGSPMSFEAIYSAYGDRVFRFCVTQVGNRDLAEEIASEALHRAFLAFDRDRPDPLRTKSWLFAIARNVILNHARSTNRWQRAFTRLTRQPAGVNDVESIATTNDLLRVCLAAVKRLRQRDRQIIGLRVGAGLSYSEIGNVIGMSEDRARTAGSRAFARLREAVKRTTAPHGKAR